MYVGNDSEEGKSSKEEKVLLMTRLRDIMFCEGAAVACAKRRDALCFVRLMLEQMSAPALNTCAKLVREGSDLAKTMILQALLGIHQSKPMRVIMKELVELEPSKKIEEIRSFSNKELRLTKEPRGTLLRSSDYCAPIRKKSYHCVSEIVGILYNPFINEDIRDCYFDYEQAVSLRCSLLSTVRNNATPQLRLVLEENVTAPSITKSDNRVEFGFRFSDELLRTSLMGVIKAILVPESKF